MDIDNLKQAEVSVCVLERERHEVTRSTMAIGKDQSKGQDPIFSFVALSIAQQVLPEELARLFYDRSLRHVFALTQHFPACFQCQCPGPVCELRRLFAWYDTPLPTQGRRAAQP